MLQSKIGTRRCLGYDRIYQTQQPIVKFLKHFYFTVFLLAALFLLNSILGCEEVANFDRGKIHYDASKPAADASTADAPTTEPDAEFDAKVDAPIDARIDAPVDAPRDVDIDTGELDAEQDSGPEVDASLPCKKASDCPEESDQCWEPTCIDEICGVGYKEPGTSCDQDFGEICDAEGKCVKATCVDEILDDDETDVDCGGRSCSACKNGEACITYEDCKSEYCKDGLAPDVKRSTVETPPGECKACSDDGDCDVIEADSWCNDGTCEEKKGNNSTCEGDNECSSGICKADYDETGSWCATSTACLHNGTAITSGYSNECFNPTSQVKCVDGGWTPESCEGKSAEDSDSSEADPHMTPGRVTVYTGTCSSGVCETSRCTDICDNSSGLLYECSANGLGASSTTYNCAKDTITECGSRDADGNYSIRAVICSSNSNNEGYCEASDISADIDLGQYACESCSFTWLANATGDNSKCCGDDANEIFEQDEAEESPERSCCYDAKVLESGSVPESSTSILCYNGQLYDCGGEGDSVIDHVDTCTQKGTLFCRSSTEWSSTEEDGCLCGESEDCTSGYCRINWDGVGTYCAKDDTSCVFDDDETIQQIEADSALCGEDNYYRVCGAETEGIWGEELTCDGFFKCDDSTRKCWTSCAEDDSPSHCATGYHCDGGTCVSDNA
jgi:hypothetical protein